MAGSFYPKRRSSIDKILESSESSGFQEIVEPKSSPTFVSKSKGFFICRFIAEVFIVGAISVLAYFLRFDDGSIFEPHYPLYSCKHFSNFPKETPVPNYFVDDSLFTYILFVAPFCTILVGESFRWVVGSVSSKIIYIWSLPIGQFPRRLIRFSGCFYFGFLLTSIIADMLGFLINRPTPSFFANCFGDSNNANVCSVQWINISQCIGANDSENFHENFRSLPNYRSAVSAYAAAYMAWYFHVLLELSGSFILGPMIACGCTAMSLLASISDLAVYKAHWEDVAVGLSLGTFMAIYIVIISNLAYPATMLKFRNFKVSVTGFFREKCQDDVMKYRHLKNPADQQMRRIQNGTTASHRDISSEHGASSSSQWIPRIQAINVGVNSNAKQVSGSLGDNDKDRCSDRATQSGVNNADSSTMNKARHNQQEPNQPHQLPISEPIQQRAPTLPGPGYYNQAYDHQPIRAYDF